MIAMRSHIVSATSSVCVDIMIVWPRFTYSRNRSLRILRRLRIEPDHRLVDDDDVRTVHERARDDELLPHAVAVALDQLVAPFLEIEQRQQLARAVLDLVALLPVQAGDEAQELARPSASRR